MTARNSVDNDRDEPEVELLPPIAISAKEGFDACQEFLRCAARYARIAHGMPIDFGDSFFIWHTEHVDGPVGRMAWYGNILIDLVRQQGWDDYYNEEDDDEPPLSTALFDFLHRIKGGDVDLDPFNWRAIVEAVDAVRRIQDLTCSGPFEVKPTPEAGSSRSRNYIITKPQKNRPRAKPPTNTRELITRQALRHIRHNPFPGVRALAKIIGCAPSTMSEIIELEPKLVEAKNKYLSQHGQVDDTADEALRKVENGELRISQQFDPAMLALARDIVTPNPGKTNEEALEELIMAERPSVRKKLREMPQDKLKELIATRMLHRAPSKRPRPT